MLHRESALVSGAEITLYIAMCIPVEGSEGKKISLLRILLFGKKSEQTKGCSRLVRQNIRWVFNSYGPETT